VQSSRSDRDGGCGEGDPTREATIAFVDIVQFTSLTDVHGDSVGADAATALERMAREQDDSDARLVKATGDGVLIEYSAPLTALRRIAMIVERVHDLGLETRAGVDHGIVVVRQQDVFGRTVNLAARLATVAEPGMIAMTRPVALVAGQAGLSVAPLGPVAVRGLRDRVEIFVADPCAHDGRWLRDPVCGMRVSAEDAILSVGDGVGRVGFCSEQCAEMYTAHPEAFRTG
jgi:class 3 adenylate cyclase/YHS domain-containing protein